MGTNTTDDRLVDREAPDPHVHGEGLSLGSPRHILHVQLVRQWRTLHVQRRSPCWQARRMDSPK